jgi:hypothetical protein
VARNPVKVGSSRAGKTNPASKVVSSADPKIKARQTPGLSYDSGGFRFLIDHAFSDFR